MKLPQARRIRETKHAASDEFAPVEARINRPGPAQNPLPLPYLFSPLLFS